MVYETRTKKTYKCPLCNRDFLKRSEAAECLWDCISELEIKNHHCKIYKCSTCRREYLTKESVINCHSKHKEIRKLIPKITTVKLNITKKEAIASWILWKAAYLKIYKSLLKECKVCHSTKELHIHHLDLDKNNNDINNLICLCRDCHWELHKRTIIIYK